MENKDPDVQTLVHKMCSCTYTLTYIGLQNCNEVCVSLLIWGQMVSEFNKNSDTFN